jgi:hypothetical protein
MKKIIAIVLVCICVLGIVGCSQQPQQVQGGQLLAEGKVINIDISSRPKGYNYSFSGKDAEAIIDYLSTLNLESNFEENPNEYMGMTWVISLKYENGDALTIHHFGNMFIRVKGGSWYKMTYDEASRFDTLLDELK